MVAVADDQAAAVFVAFVGKGGDIGVDLGLERFGEHAAGALTHEFVDQRWRRGSRGRGAVAVGGVRDYGEHGCAFPTDVGASVMLVDPHDHREGTPFPMIHRSQALLSAVVAYLWGGCSETGRTPVYGRRTT
ncbi:hypothetical protein GCM10022224_093590 [Nonomuraea antimicrobica]|uniref:Uncharacterized protein n=1 Tax=Nonomuraea antimicrobica TaxID=561173 RepID=A0ABP7E2E7_9ACTN